MNIGVVVWLLVFAVSGVIFFCAAAVVSVKGLGDLRALLRHSRRRDGPGA